MAQDRTGPGFGLNQDPYEVEQREMRAAERVLRGYDLDPVAVRDAFSPRRQQVEDERGERSDVRDIEIDGAGYR